MAPKERRFFRYDLPSVKGEGWGVIVMCSDGYFSTVSDWGNYAYWWTHTGERDFRQFFLGCDADYIRCKLNPERVMDSEATAKKLRAYVCSSRRRKTELDEHDARELWSRAYVSSDLEFWDWIREFGELGGVLPDSYVEEVPKDKPHSDIMGFVTYLLPRLKEVIQAELATEAPPAPPTPPPAAAEPCPAAP